MYVSFCSEMLVDGAEQRQVDRLMQVAKGREKSCWQIWGVRRLDRRLAGKMMCGGARSVGGERRFKERERAKALVANAASHSAVAALCGPLAACCEIFLLAAMGACLVLRGAHDLGGPCLIAAWQPACTGPLGFERSRPFQVRDADSVTDVRV